MGPHSPSAVRDTVSSIWLALTALAGRCAPAGRLLLCGLLTSCAWAGICDGAGTNLHYRVWTAEDGLPQNSVRAIAQTPDGYLWFATLDGLVRFDGLRLVVFAKSNVPEMTSNRCLALLVDRRGDLWISTEDGGILLMQGTRFRAFDRASGFVGRGGGLLAEDREGRIWTNSDGRFIFYDGERWQAPDPTMPGLDALGAPAAPAAELPDSLASTPPRPDRRRSIVGAGGRLWVFDGGFLHLREEDAWRTFTNPVPAVALPVPSVLFEDREGTLWIGGEQGLVQATQTGVRAVVPPGSANERNVYTLAEDSAGRIWVTTQGEPLLWERGSLGSLATRPWWPAGFVTSIKPDTDGSVLAGTPSGVYRVWPGRGFERLPRTAPVYDTLRDRSGSLWAATEKGLLQQTGSEWRGVSAVPWHDVKVLLEARDGALWVGAYGGLARIAGDQVRTWTTADGLSSDRIRALHEDEAGALWIGTYDGGLNRLADGRIVSIRKRDGLYDDGVFAILDGGDGRFYMSSNRGIFSVAKRELQAFASGALSQITHRLWRRGEGLPSSECNGGRQPAGFRAADGTLWFPTQHGIGVIDPRAVSFNRMPPIIVIEGVSTERRSVPLGSEIELQPGERRLEVRYTANTFVRPEGARFRHRLAGLEDEWVDAGERRFAQYAAVPPGRYVLTVLASNSDGVWTPEGVSLSIRVLPYWWQTSWFRAASVLLVVLLLGTGYRRRVRSLKRRRAEQDAFARQLLESQEAERKRIASELHDGLGQRLVIINNLALLTARLASADVRERAEEISAEATHAIGEVREIAHDLRPALLDRLGLSKSLDALARRAADASGIEIPTGIDQIDNVFPKEAEINVYRIIQECLNNVLRHSGATQARLTIRRSPTEIQLVIEDNGRGFQMSGPGRRAGHGGHGLAGIAERATLLAGRVDVRSAPGHGTRITVSFDLRKLTTLVVGV